MSRTMHVSIFLVIFAAILTVSHLYIFWRLSSYLQLDETARWILGCALGFMGVATLVALPLSRTLPHNAASVLSWVVFPWMGCLLLLLVSVIITDIVWIASHLLRLAPHDPERRQVFHYALGFSALGAAGTASAYAAWNGLRPVSVKPVEVTLDRWPLALDGLRVVQVSDLHIGPLIDGVWLNHVVDQINELKPDMIVITGDLVDGSIADLAAQVEPLAKLQAPEGIYFITGNHEYYSGAEEWCAHVASLGIRVLRNEWVRINTPRGSFDLAGVDDFAARQHGGKNITETLAERDAARPVILLAHQPKDVHEAAANNVDLQLSGHTHGGQIWPFNLLVYLQQPFTEGLHRYKETATQIYVSAGTGFWGPPMRLGTTAEITHLTLRSKT